ncbi:MAG: hypothetical protein M3N68_09915, partial [Actinomycetota bacterium]|nr:hypothetical protein [Actinomycetota bacterium]
MTTRWRLAVLGMAALASGLGPGCSSDRLQTGSARLSVDGGGRTLAAERGQRLQEVRGGRTLHRGARVEVVTGTARLGVSEGSLVELREGTTLELGTLPILVSGDALVSAEAGRSVSVEAAGSRVTVAGAARVSRDLAVSARTYRGVSSLGSAGRSLRVPALRQAAIPSLGLLPPGPQPLAYDARDPWDRRFLGAAIDLGEELQAKSRGFTASVPAGEGRTPGFFRLLLPALEAEPAFAPSLLSPARSPGETLVGAVIAVSGRRGSFTARWTEVFSFRDEGAAWGLVALDQGVTEAAALVQSVDAAIGRAPLAFAPPAPPAPRNGPAGTGGGGGRA